MIFQRFRFCTWGALPLGSSSRCIVQLPVQLRVLLLMVFCAQGIIATNSLLADDCGLARKKIAGVDFEGSKDALLAYREATRLCPEMVEAWHNKGVLYSRVEQFSEAESALRRSLELSDSVRTRRSLGLVLFQAHRLQEAQAELEIVLDRESDDVEALHALSLVLDGLGNTTEAIVATERALAAQPLNGSLLFNYAVLLEKRGNLTEAEDAYRRALRTEQPPIETSLRLAHLLVQRAEPDEAERVLESVLTMEPAQPDALRALAFLREERGDIEGAEVLLRSLVRSSSVESDDRLRLASVLVIQRQASLAKEILQDIPQGERSSLRYLLVSAAVESALGNSQSAERQLREALRIDATNREARELLVSLLQQLGRDADAQVERKRFEQMSARD